MVTLAYIVAALILPALAASIVVTTYHVPTLEDPDVRFDSEIDRQQWALMEMTLHRVDTVSTTIKGTRGYGTVVDEDTGLRIARALTRKAAQWFAFTQDERVVELEILRQLSEIAWQWRPAAGGYRLDIGALVH